MFGWLKIGWQTLRRRVNRGNGMFYRRSLILILVITSIPGLITGSLIYWFAGGRIENEMVQLHKNQVSKRAEILDAQFSHSEQTLAHWAFDPLFDIGLLETDFYRQFDVSNNITKTLMVMEGSIPMSTGIELYVKGKMSAQFSPGFNLIGSGSADEKLYQELLNEKTNAFWTLLPSDKGQNTDLALVYKIPGGAMERFGLLIARTGSNKLQEMMKALTMYDGGEAVLLQEDGTVLASSSPFPQSSLLAELKSRTLGRAGTPVTFVWNWEGQKYSVSIGNFDRVGSAWTYVSAAPVNSIISPVIYLSKLVALVSAAALLLAFLLAWFASRRIYSPMKRLMGLLSGGRLAVNGGVRDEFQFIESEWRELTSVSRALQSKLEMQLPQVKQGFLYQLIQGYLSSYTEEELRERFCHYGWRTDCCRYRVLYIRLTGMSNASMAGRFSLGDEELISFAAANIAGETAGERFGQYEVINFHDLTIAVLLGLDERESSKDRLYEFGEILIRTLHQILKLQVTVAIGGSTTVIKQIPELLEEARLALNYRKWDEQNQLLDVETLPMRGKNQGFQYPFAVERELIQAMRTGKLEEVEQQLRLFLEELTRDGATDLDVQQGVLNLLGSLEHEIMQSGLNPNQLLAPVNRFERLSELREPEHILRWFVTQVIRPFLAEMENRSDHKIKKIVEQAIEFIEHNYMKDISLDDCAEFCGTNAFLLSRSFKLVAGKNFIDYLTDLRMEKAKELLRDSEQRIYDIAEQVGYQHSYFNRLFKKFEGMTPTQYRDRIRKA